jgi:FMN reductase
VTPRPVHVLALDDSPRGSGRTRIVLDEVLSGAAAKGAIVDVISLADGPPPTERLRQFDAFVLGSPIYRASYATPLKAFLDACPRGMWGELEAPLTGHAVSLVATGATWHHYLAVDSLRNVIAGFFAAHPVSPGLYVPNEGFAEPDNGEILKLTEPFAKVAAMQGTTLVALARAIASSPALSGVTPQV